MGSLYHSDENDDFIGPSLEEMAENRARVHALNEAERIAHTYILKIGNVSFQCCYQWNSPDNGKMWLKMEAKDIPEECIPSDISRECLDRYLWKSWKGCVQGSFVEQDGVFVASPAWMDMFVHCCAKVRDMHKIYSNGEYYSFPIINLHNGEGKATNIAMSLIKGYVDIGKQVLPVRRDGRHWVLDAN
jgi:hypothetical protein